jgi:hypothetical protein
MALTLLSSTSGAFAPAFAGASGAAGELAVRALAVSSEPLLRTASCSAIAASCSSRRCRSAAVSANRASKRFSRRSMSPWFAPSTPAPTPLNVRADATCERGALCSDGTGSFSARHRMTRPAAATPIATNRARPSTERIILYSPMRGGPDTERCRTLSFFSTTCATGDQAGSVGVAKSLLLRLSTTGWSSMPNAEMG